MTTGKRLRLVLAAATCAAVLAPSPAHAARPLETAVTDGGPFNLEPEWAFERVRDAGARSARVFVFWSGIAPVGEEKPDGFNPRNPADPAYDWTRLDRQVRAAAAAGISPILAISRAPRWAERPESDFRPGTWRPRPSDFGDFAFAVAKRYSGNFGGLPRVSRWQVWNEPNLFSHILPQYDTPISKQVTVDSNPESPNVYRPLVNSFAAEVHSVHPDNLVIAGGLAPFGRYAAYDHGVPPLQFMRELLCLSKRNRPKPGCNRVSFDVWSTHPYTQGGPTHSAALPDNVSLGDLPEMRRVLRAAERAGRIRSENRVQFWVTEISWDTSPPDSGGVPLKLHARWVSEAIYRMWRDGISLVTWFQIRDEEENSDEPESRQFTSGLYFFCTDGFMCARPKPALRAFRFPFVAFRKGKRIRFWGRTPAGVQADVTVQQHRGSHWRTVAAMRTNQYGIFKGRFRTGRRGKLRAKGLDDRSQPFSLKRPRDFAVNPFGGCEFAEAEHPVCPNN